jgi:thioredoxin 1
LTFAGERTMDWKSLMPVANEFLETEPARADVDALQEAVVVEFGAPWCGHCNAAKPLVAAAFSGYPQVRHLKVEDGPGRPLGRSFRVKLWPTRRFSVTARLNTGLPSRESTRSATKLTVRYSRSMLNRRVAPLPGFAPSRSDRRIRSATK